MLQLNFENLRAELPSLAKVWARLEGWLRAHPNEDEIDPYRLGRDLRDVDATDLALALKMLEQLKILERKFRVIAPTTHTPVEEPYDSLSDIPDSLPDRFRRYFDTSEAEIRPVLRAR
jgi:hypothetical protein